MFLFQSEVGSGDVGEQLRIDTYLILAEMRKGTRCRFGSVDQ